MSKKNLVRTETKNFMENKSNIVDIKDEWILFRWKKSLWKRVWKELLAYTLVFVLISLVYRYFITEAQENFEKIVKYVRESKENKHLTFILGLYIGIVVKRWWDQYSTLPWPDELALHLQACVIDQSGSDEKGRQVRRSIVRYCLASYILAIRTQSSVLRERFPDIHKLVERGLLQKDELEEICEFGCMEKITSRWWVPMHWSMQLLADAKRDGFISTGPEYASLVSRVTDFKHKLEMVKAYGSNPLPLMYSQVVHLAVYVYLALTLISDQCASGDESHFCFPLNTLPLVFKFLFYYGLLTVSTSLYNPWGDDDEDFRLNDLLSRHLKVAMEIVDGTQNAPELRKDNFWGQSNPEMLDNIDHGAGGEINTSFDTKIV